MHGWVKIRGIFGGGGSKLGRVCVLLGYTWPDGGVVWCGVVLRSWLLGEERKREWREGKGGFGGRVDVEHAAFEIRLWEDFRILRF